MDDKSIAHAINQSPVSIIITDEHGTIEYVNSILCEISGFTPEEIQGYTIHRLMPGDSGVELSKKLELCKNSGDKWTGELYSRKKNGKLFKENILVAPFYRKGETRIHFIIIKNEIMHNPDGESKLIKSEKKYKTLLETCADPIVIYDSMGCVESVNQAFTDVFGWTQKELFGKQIDFVPENSVDETQETTKRVLNGESVTGFETTRYGKNRELIHVRIGAALITNEDNKPTGLIVNFQDTTENWKKTKEIKELNVSLMNTFDDMNRKNKELEKIMTQLKQSQAQILQSEKMASIGQLAAGVAHEINNPIGFVNSNLNTLTEYQKEIESLHHNYKDFFEALKKESSENELPQDISGKLNRILEIEEEIDIDFLKEDSSELIADCLEGVERIKKIVLNLKDFAHPGEDKLKPSSINKGLESTLNIVRNELKYKAEIETDYRELPVLECYPQQLNQVFMNILINAAQAIKDRGVIKIKTELSGSLIIIKISDTGKGISKENIPKIFDPFFTTKEIGKGTGLGMNIAYNIIKKHKGSISVDSTPGKGTTFTIKLPVKKQVDN